MTARRLNPRSAAFWATVEPPRRRWLVDGLIPSGVVTLLSGEGGVGKSALMVALALAVSTGTPWIGRPVVEGAVFAVFAEDDADEIGRRLRSIALANGVDLSAAIDLEYLALNDLTDGAMLATAADSGVRATDLFVEIERIVMTSRPALIVLDCVAELFGGDENRRAEVAPFVRLLSNLAAKSGAAIVLISHPSLTGLATGSGLSGSTAWNGAVRSRLYLTAPDKDDTDRRVLIHAKSNYGRKAAGIEMRMTDGRFVATDRTDPAAGRARAEAVFIDLLRRFNAEGRNVSDATGTNYAPVLFAREPEAKGMSKEALRDAMSALFRADRLVIETRRDNGKDRKRLVEKGSDSSPATGPATAPPPAATASDGDVATAPRHRPATAPAPASTGPATTPLSNPPAGGDTGTTAGGGRPDADTATTTATGAGADDDGSDFRSAWPGPDIEPDHDWTREVAA